MRDGYSRFMLTVIAAALLALLALELGWLPRGDAGAGVAPSGRWQFTALRYGPMGNFLARFDTATGRLERVRFPANDVVWEEVGVVPSGKAPVSDPLRPPAATTQGPGITLGRDALRPGAPPPIPPADAPGAEQP